MIFEYLIMFLVAFQQISSRFFLHQLSLLDALNKFLQGRQTLIFYM